MPSVPSVLTGPPDAPPPATAAALSGETAAPSAADLDARALQAARGVCSAREEAFARAFVLYRNATTAYCEVVPAEKRPWPRNVVRQRAWEMSRKPAVVARIREYESAAARACVIDVQAILASDLAIVQAAAHARDLSKHIWQACRYCYGTEHKYQWVDLVEYLEALSKVEEQNEARRERKQRELQLPSDEGGFGYSPGNEPNVTCPKCEGRGTHVTIICDTEALEGPAAALFKGVKTTANGTELLMQDVDKAKERLLRAAGAFGDDASNVARAAAAGAAAGSAAGATAAQKVAERVKDMSAEEVRRAYLTLVS